MLGLQGEGTDGWRLVTPTEVGLAQDGFDRIDDAHQNGLLPNLHSLVVIRDGSIVFERYYTGSDEIMGNSLGEVQFDQDTLHDLRSVSKSIVALLYGIALAKGIVPPPDANLIANSRLTPISLPILTAGGGPSSMC